MSVTQLAEAPHRAVNQPSSNEAPRRVRVVVVDDHAMVAQGLAALLEQQDDLTVVGIALGARQSLSVVGETRPDVVRVDYRLPDGDGASVAAEILRRWPETRVVMLSAGGSETDDLLARAVEAGCSGFLAKERSAAEVVSAVRAAARGESLIPTAALAGLLGRLRRSPKHGTGDLTARELEVLRMLAKGMSTQQIRQELYLSEHTVRNHVRNILAKLGAHSKLEAVALAARKGIVTLAERR
jgi:DNA-binding NarL/FixJ family response regulator